MNKNEWKWVWGAFKVHRRNHGVWGAIKRLPVFGRYFVTPISDGENLTLEERLKREFDKAYRDLDKEYVPFIGYWRHEMRKMLKPGDTIIVNPPIHGSVGIITSSRKHDDGFYVAYNYGKDANGRPWVSTGSIERSQLVPISRALYDKYVACSSFSPQQRLVHREIMKELREQGWVTRGAYDDFEVSKPMVDPEEAQDARTGAPS